MSDPRSPLLRADCTANPCREIDDPAIRHLPDGSVDRVGLRPLALLSGSFNPLHTGHKRLAEAARQRLGYSVEFEISTANVDKPELDPAETTRRIAQFRGYAPVWITQAPTFLAKARLFPQTTFVIGWDTAVRLVDSTYYGGESRQRDRALETILDSGCRMLVGGRTDTHGVFRIRTELEAHTRFSDLFLFLTEAEFRVDISSTELRRVRE